MRTRNLVVAAVVALVVPVAAQGQGNTAGVNVIASASVMGQTEASHVSDLSFGEIVIGENGVIEATDVTATRGEVTITHNTGIEVAVVFPEVLRREDDTSITLAFSGNCAYRQGSTDSGLLTGSACEAVDITHGGAVGTQATTSFYLGGTITGDTGAGIGTFSGTIRVDVTAVNN